VGETGWDTPAEKRSNRWTAVFIGFNEGWRSDGAGNLRLPREFFFAPLRATLSFNCEMAHAGPAPQGQGLSMTTSPIAGSSGATAPTVSSTATSAASSTENQFLSILTTELTNQDPLNAMDASTFTSQLVSYAGLEQQITTNSQLTGITSLLTSIAASSTGTKS
jgi:hypothetical protein